MWLIPHGTVQRTIVSTPSSYDSRISPIALTVSVRVQVFQLVTPLCQNSQSILQERDNNEEASNGGKVWLDRIRPGVQQILNLARLLANGVEGRGVVGRGRARGPTEGGSHVLVAEVVSRCSSNLRHVELYEGEEGELRIFEVRWGRAEEGDVSLGRRMSLRLNCCYSCLCLARAQLQDRIFLAAQFNLARRVCVDVAGRMAMSHKLEVIERTILRGTRVSSKGAQWPLLVPRTLKIGWLPCRSKERSSSDLVCERQKRHVSVLRRFKPQLVLRILEESGKTVIFSFQYNLLHNEYHARPMSLTIDQVIVDYFKYTLRPPTPDRGAFAYSTHVASPSIPAIFFSFPCFHLDNIVQSQTLQSDSIPFQDR